ncbi:unnamed protein product [Cylicocyclus nassatus]|uniref:Uncharacterized protein n=1 Tax=Cylicocyclus nassatus TaxID=53992 RepID=A0AA36MDT9_CYLNA|nr:unnamed protein product [Cylicocyclus nassatus]
MCSPFESILCQVEMLRVLPSNAQLSACKKFQFLKRRRDIATISQMLFGAMSTAVGNDSSKIHIIPDDQRLLVSRLSIIPRLSSKDMRVAADSLESSDLESHYIAVRSMDSINGLHQKHGCISSTAPPEAFKRIRNASLQLDDETTEEARLFSPPTAFRLSRDRRLEMSHKTNLCEQCRHGRSFANQFVNYITLHDFVICLVSLLERDHNGNVVVADFSRQLTRLVEKLDTKHSKSFCQM